MAYECINSDYTQECEIFETVEEFRTCCREATGEDPSLTEQPLNGVVVDSDGEVILVDLDDAEAAERHMARRNRGAVSLGQ